MTAHPQARRAPFTCGICGAVSYHPADKRHGYCGRCAAFIPMEPLELTDAVVLQLRALGALAARHQINVADLQAALQQPVPRLRHMAHMQMLTICLPGPVDYLVTYTEELGHPVGACRHLAVRVDREGQVPGHACLWHVAQVMGFRGGLVACSVLREQEPDEDASIHLLQPMWG